MSLTTSSDEKYQGHTLWAKVVGEGKRRWWGVVGEVECGGKDLLDLDHVD
jgi:hypothetical protein